ncbi:hypothetical protein [Paludisphaera mucosa]|uniref:Uncharacterized protein n=1 Tax=Paludisphaera mucosa TaxID=3030827 RepID=A0ABT6FAL2_9BACT|nr:hypothetical protein [Paludisphaera mucosa]MDG3004627.1 hypothetical protein [Paludisphaera mucosa]
MPLRILALAALLAALADPAARGQSYPGAPQFFPPGRPDSGSLPRLADSLADEARQAADDVRYELAGSYLANQAGMRAEALARSAASFRDQARRGAPNLQGAFLDVDRAYTALAGVLGGGRVSAPRASNALDRIQRLSYQIRSVIGSYDAGSPGLPPNRDPRWDARGVGAATSNLQIAADRASQMLAGRRDPAGVRASASAASLLEQNRYFQGMQTSTARAEDLWQMVQQIRLVAWDLFLYPTIAAVDPPTRDAIVGVRQQLDRLCGFFAIDPRGPIEDPAYPPGSNRIVRPPPPDPAYGGPPPIQPPIQPPILPPPGIRPPRPPVGPGHGFRPGPEFVSLLNEAIGQLDGYLQTLGAHVNQVKQGRQFQSEAQQLRGALEGLYQRVRDGAPRRELRGALELALRHSDTITAHMNAIVGAAGGPMVAQFRAADQSLRRMNQMLP